jgi:archaellum component FlaG (FlaF/FlaG flagellin family)
MADKARGKISMTPVVTIAADSDADAVDAIHHDIKSSLGGPLSYTTVDANDKWFYAPNVIVTDTAEELFADNTNDTDLVGASGDQTNGPNEAIGAALETTDGTAVDTDVDVLRFLFIKNTGTSDINNTSTTNSVYVCLDGSTPSHTSKCIEIASGEAWMARINIKVDQIHIITGQSRAAGTSATVNGSTSVRCTVAAIIDDGG